MLRAIKIGVSASLALLMLGLAASAQPQNEGREGHEGHEGHEARPEPHQAEPHPGPQRYQRVEPPKGWNARPQNVDRSAYQHNYRAERSYKIGPYHRPPGWAAHRWSYGEILPRAYWAPDYVISDYWLFALEVPPPGYEWVRDDTDALLVNVSTGEILQVEYGVFG